MKIIAPLIFIAFLFAPSCKQKGNGATAIPNPDSASATGAQRDSTAKNYFPVAEYLRGEIRLIDSTPEALVRYTTLNNRTDSSFINPTTFNRLAEQFLVPELDSASFANHFKESSFADGTTASVTFSYSPAQTASPSGTGSALYRVDVVLDENDNNRVKSIYMERTESAGDTVVNKKLLWTAGREFLIISTRQLGSKPPVVNQLKVVWDNSPRDQN